MASSDMAKLMRKDVELHNRQTVCTAYNTWSQKSKQITCISSRDLIYICKADQPQHTRRERMCLALFGHFRNLGESYDSSNEKAREMSQARDQK